MRFETAFRTILERQNLTQTDVAARAGTSQGAVAGMLAKGNPSVDVALRYLSACGYVLAAVPVGGKLPEGSLVVDEQGRCRR